MKNSKTIKYVLAINCHVDVLLQQAKYPKQNKKLLGLEYGVVPFVHMTMKRVCLRVIYVEFSVIHW